MILLTHNIIDKKRPKNAAVSPLILLDNSMILFEKSLSMANAMKKSKY